MRPEQGPQHIHFGGGVSESVFNPAVLAVMILAGILILVWPRKKTIVPFLAAALLIPMDQVLVISGFHFPMLRILLFFGIARIVKEKVSSKRRLFTGGVNKLDITVILFSLLTAVSAVLLFQESAALVNELGNIYTVFGVYFLFRFLIRDEDDIGRVIRTLAYISAVVAVTMIFEVATGHNPYAMLGGASAPLYASLVERADRFRAQGPFGHSILAGTFGAVLMPLFVGLWWKWKEHRRTALLGILSATLITLTSNSSTPVLAYAGGVLAFCLWPVRQWMRAIRWGLVITVVALQFVLKNPVWHLIARIDISGGSSGYHRFMLIDQCIRHFWDWWLIGVKDTSVWGWDMWDTANQYVGTCDNSGLLAFLLFLATLVYGFKFLGRARQAVEPNKKSALFIWAIGAALFANVVAFFGISYWDQTIVSWYALLATISAVALVHRKKAIPSPVRILPDDLGALSQGQENSVPIHESTVQRQDAGADAGADPVAWHQIDRMQF